MTSNSPTIANNSTHTLGDWERAVKYRFGKELAPNAQFGDKEVMEFLEAFEEEGYIGLACEKVGISRSSINKFMERDEAFKQAIDDIKAKKKEAFEKRIDDLAMNDGKIIKEGTNGTEITTKANMKAIELKMRKESPELYNARIVKHEGKVEHFVALPEPEKIDDKSKVIEGDWEVIEAKKE